MNKCVRCGNSTIVTTCSTHYCMNCEQVVDTTNESIVFRHENKDINPTYRCNDCNFLAFTKEELKDHLNTTHPATYKCVFCLFENKNELKVIHHLQVKHSFEIRKRNEGIIPSKKYLHKYRSVFLKCIHCGNISKGEIKYKEHLQGCSRNNKNKYEKISPLKTSLKSSKQPKEVKNRFECLHCDYKAPTSREFIEHIESVHNIGYESELQMKKNYRSIL